MMSILTDGVGVVPIQSKHAKCQEDISMVGQEEVNQLPWFVHDQSLAKLPLEYCVILFSREPMTL